MVVRTLKLSFFIDGHFKQISSKIIVAIIIDLFKRVFTAQGWKMANKKGLEVYLGSVENILVYDVSSCTEQIRLMLSVFKQKSLLIHPSKQFPLSRKISGNYVKGVSTHLPLTLPVHSQQVSDACSDQEVHTSSFQS